MHKYWFIGHKLLGINLTKRKGAMKIRAKRIYTNNGIIDGFIIVSGGIIQDIASGNVEGEDYSDCMIIPGIIDTHNHGAMGYTLVGKCDNKREEILGFLKGVAAQGVTSVFPTPSLDYFEDIVNISDENHGGADIVGIHSEGPYLSRVGENGVAEEPEVVDIRVIQKMIDDGQGLLKLVAIAPELPNAQEAIDLLVKNGIRVAYAHSDMNYKEAYYAFNHGLTVATHTANVMSGIHHREMGGLGACLLHPGVECELIPDGLHVSTEMMELMFKVKPYDRWILVSDTTSTSGAPKGRYRFGKHIVVVDDNGFAKTETGRLMGSTQPVLYGMKVLHNELGIPLEIISQMASSNPAKVYGIDDRKGVLAKGKDADFIVIDDDFNLIATYVKGQKVYDSKEGKNYFNPNFEKLT